MSTVEEELENAEAKIEEAETKESKETKGNRRIDPRTIVRHNGVQKYRDPFINSQRHSHNDADNIYLNITISADLATELALTEAVYSATRTTSLLDKASDYYLSVIRFNIPAYYTPIAYFLGEIGAEVNEDNELPGIYFVSLSYDNYTVTKQINMPVGQGSANYFSPQPLYTPAGNRILYLFDYYRWVDAINRALIDAYLDLQTMYPGNGNKIDYEWYENTPILRFNSITKLFTLWFPLRYERPIRDDDQDPDGYIKLYFNEFLFELFDSFPATRTSSTINVDVNNPSGLDYEIQVNGWSNNLAYPDVSFADRDPPYLYVQIPQNYISLFNWNPFERIVLTTSLIPVRGENIKGSGSDFLKIITDFIPPNEIIEVRSTFQYIATGQYRLIDLTSDDELRQVDVQVFWEDRYGNLQIFYLQPNATITMKLAFINKELYHHNHLKGYVSFAKAPGDHEEFI